MSVPSISRLTLVTSLILLLYSSSLHGDFIQPVAVQASNGEATQDTLIDGQGLDNPGIGSPTSLHNRLA
jgi:hypothetical protein